MQNGSGPLAVFRFTAIALFAIGFATAADAVPTVSYNPTNGQVSVDTSDGTLLTTLLVTGPVPSSVDRWLDGTFQDNVSWAEMYFDAIQQWSGAGGFGDPPVGQPFVDPGTYQIATYATGLGAVDFPADVEIGTQLDVSGTNPGDILFVPLTIANPAIPGDYDASSLVGLSDLNLVLFNWNADGSALPSEWVNERPGLGTSVGLTQLNGVLFNWGNAALVAAVPEPASISLGLVALVLGATIERRRN